jgi:copper chaperone
MINLLIEGMSCGHCVAAVRKALSAVPGVKEVTEVDLERGRARIEGNADPRRLIAAIEEEGYQAHEAPDGS